MEAFAARVRIGMVGGGPGAGIGQAHRIGLRMDARFDLVAGAFSRDAAKSRAMGQRLGIDAQRIYTSYEAMAQRETQREDGIEVVAIVTPNDSHYAIAKTFLGHGIHVVCDKPLTDDLERGLELHRLAQPKDQSKNLVLALTHNYANHAMVCQAARMVRDGALGDIRRVQAEFASGWAAEAVEGDADNKQAAWRTDPKQAGRASVILDLGTHVHHLTRFVTGLEIEALASDLATSVPGRQVYDDATVMLRLTNGARGALWISMAATGQEHGLAIRVFGSKAALEWHHEDPHHLVVRHPDGRTETLAQGGATLSDDAQRLTRIGLGHPEGFLESFANIYADIADAIVARRAGRERPSDPPRFATSRDGVLGLQFVAAVCDSFAQGSAWTRLEPLDL